MNTPLLQQISLMDNGVLDEIEETPGLFYVAFVFRGSYIWSIMCQGCVGALHLCGHMGAISAVSMASDYGVSLLDSLGGHLPRGLIVRGLRARSIVA